MIKLSISSMLGLVITTLLPVAMLTFPDGSLKALDHGYDREMSSQLESGVLLLPDSTPETPYYRILLRRPADPRGPSFGQVGIAFPESPFNVAVTRSGHYIYDLFVSVQRPLPQTGVTYVAWLATPDLRRVERLGAIGPGEVLQHRVDFENKFVVFISEESDPDVGEVSGRIVLKGTSRSGRIESMFSHGFCPPDVQC